MTNKNLKQQGASDSLGITRFHASRRNLPHWEEPGSTYFVTWSTAGRLKLLSSDRTVALDSIRYWDNERWIVYAAVVMPDHVHLLIQPLVIPDSNPQAWYPLQTLIHSVKTYSAHEINKARNRHGAVWLDERYDRVVRNEDEFWRKWQYIRDNPVKARLARTTEEYPWFYQRSGEVVMNATECKK